MYSFTQQYIDLDFDFPTATFKILLSFLLIWDSFPLANHNKGRIVLSRSVLCSSRELVSAYWGHVGDEFEVMAK